MEIRIMNVVGNLTKKQIRPYYEEHFLILVE